MNGFPCPHAAAAIYNSGLRSGNVLIDYIKEYFFAQYYREAYSMPIESIVNSRMQEVSSSECFILPLICKKLLGRPRTKRIPSGGEKRQIRCGICGKIGNHNRKTCKEVV